MKIDEVRRQEIGRKRRERTRERLLLAAARVIANLGEARSNINDFISAAGVGRGTFYNYYSTREDIIRDLWDYIGHDPFEKIVAVMQDIDDPAERIATFLRLVISRCENDNTWGWVVYTFSENEKELNADLRFFPIPDLVKGWDAGRFDIDDVDVALPLVVGTIRTLLLFTLQGRGIAKRVDQVAALVLRGLGLPAQEATAIASIPLPSLDAAGR